jgi:prepilin-type N-terminal cleavage/methylation domain-containing protein
MQKRKANNEPTRHGLASGFSLVETTVVVAIFLVIASITVPNLPTLMLDMKLRGAAQELAGFYQQARMRAVQDDTYYEVLPTADVPGLFLDVNGNGTPASAPRIELPAEVTLINAGAPAGLDPAKLGFQPPASTDTFDHDGTDRPGLAWSARGLPCQRLSATSICQGGNGWIQYLQYNGNSQPAYAAVSVSPAGRTRVWVYQGGVWR